MRKLLFALALTCCLTCWSQHNHSETDDAATSDMELFEEYDGSEGEGIDSLTRATYDSIIAASSKFTAAELSSPMMSVSEPKTTKGNGKGSTSKSLTDWILDHLFISSLLALLIAFGGPWLVYRICSYLFITLKKS